MTNKASGTLIRVAVETDLPTIVLLLATDPLGALREACQDPVPKAYVEAFDAIQKSGCNELLVAEVDGAVVGVLQITYIPYLTYQGGRRALIEGVRVDSTARSRGIGKRLIEEAVGRARAHGCHMVQLTSDKSREQALQFYEAQGFVASHEGLKRHLPKAESDA